MRHTHAATSRMQAMLSKLTEHCQTKRYVVAAAFCGHPSFGPRGFGVGCFTSDNPIAPRDWRKTLQVGGWLAGCSIRHGSCSAEDRLVVRCQGRLKQELQCGSSLCHVQRPRRLRMQLAGGC